MKQKRRDFVLGTASAAHVAMVMQDVHHRHRNVVPVMAMGIAALKRDLPAGMSMDRLFDVHEFLDSFYMSRIGIRMLIGQHIELHRPPRENYIGEYT